MSENFLIGQYLTALQITKDAIFYPLQGRYSVGYYESLWINISKGGYTFQVEGEFIDALTDEKPLVDVEMLKELLQTHLRFPSQN